jgi:DNA-binding beta-propeller fold protein YncE
MARWYVSFHGGTGPTARNNLHVYSEAGEHVGAALSRRELPEHVQLRELRGFAFGPDGDLYLANGFKDANQILRFQGTPGDDGKHHFASIFTAHHATNRGLLHPFAVLFGPDGNLYVSSQDTAIVGRYHGPTATDGPPGAPMNHPPALRNYPTETLHPGTFIPSAHHVPSGLQAVRHALFGPDGHLYVADREANRIKRYHAITGELLGELGGKHLTTPVHLLFRDDGILLTGSRDRNAVFAIDPATGTVTPLVEPGAGDLREPAGLALGVDAMLYVASRGSHAILRYDATTGKPEKRPFISHLGDQPEFIRLVTEERSVG